MKQHKFSRAVLWFTKITGLPIYFLLRYKLFFEGDNKKLRHSPSPSIIMSNHKSLLDFPLYLSIFYSKTLHFLMAEVLFEKNPFLNWLLFKLGGIRVDRNAFDFSFVGEALEILDRGGIVGVFPEGRLPVKGTVLPFKPGIVYIALRTNAPIVPIYTDGCYGLFKRAKVIIGESISLHDYCKTENPSNEEIDQLTRLLKDKIDSLREELERKDAQKK